MVTQPWAENLVATDEILKRIWKNKVNAYFGLLLLAHRKGDIEGQNNPIGQLRGIFLSIPDRKNWSTKDRDTWIGAIDEALREQCKKFADSDARGIFLKMAQGGFGYVYKAVENKLTDELRGMIRSGRETPQPSQFFRRFRGPSVDPDRELQSLGTLRLIELKRKNANEPIAGVLGAIGNLLRQLEHIGDKTVSQVRELLLKEIVAEREVSLQQARKDHKRFRREDIPEIREALEALAPKERFSVSFRRVAEVSDTACSRDA
jgi:hypothetical protein